MTKTRTLGLALALCWAWGLSAQINDGGTLPVSRWHSHLSSSVPKLTAPVPDWDKVKAEDEAREAAGEALIIGHILPIHADLQQSGQWELLPNGDRLWRLHLESKGAYALSLYFSDFHLPKGAKLHVYSPDRKQVLGGFTDFNNPASGYFATEYIGGSALVLEYYEPVFVRGQGRFRVDELGHAYKDVLNFGSSGACMINVNCSEGSGRTNQRDAVSRILVRRGFSQGWCTGTLINNTRQNCTPYYLTAMHCAGNNSTLASASDLNQWIFYFNFQSANCPNPSTSPTTSQTVTGCVRRAYSADNGGASGSDMFLVELNNPPPANYNVYYAGWDRNNTAVTGGYGIHHPRGDIKKIAVFNGTTTTTDWQSSGLQSHWRVVWSPTTNGHSVTEPGSSGSALFNNQGLIIGTLTGGGAACNNLTAPDVYGKMSYHWASNGTSAGFRLRDWLDPDNTNATTLAGVRPPCGSGGGVGADAAITAIINPTPGSLICTNPVVPQVVLRNMGNTALSSVSLRYQINSGTVSTQAWTGSLAAGASTTVTLPSITAPSGVDFTFRAWTNQPNGLTDLNPANDTAQAVSRLQASRSLPYSQAFESTGIPSEISTLDATNDGFVWQRTNIASGFGQGTGSMMFDNFSGSSSANPGGSLDWMFLPAFSLNGLSNPRLRFDVAYAPYSETFSDTLIVGVATNCGTVYQSVYYLGGENLSTTGGFEPAIFTPTASQWFTENIDLNSYAGQSQVVIAFVNKSGYGNRIFVDNISVEADGVSSISLVPNEPLFILQPNPTAGQFQVNVRFEDFSEYRLSVVDALGRELLQTQGQAQELQEWMNLSGQAPGVYFVRLQAGARQYVRKLILQP